MNSVTGPIKTVQTFLFYQQLYSYWRDFNLWTILNTAFVTSIAGAGLATYWGARTAEKTSINNDERRERLAELRQVNLSILVSFTVANLLLSAKKQFVLEMLAEYFGSRDKFIQDLAAARGARGAGRTTIRVMHNFHLIDVPKIPLTSLELLVFEKISAPSRVLAATVSLRQAYENLERSMGVRAELIREYTTEARPYAYFGIKHDGREDRRYYDTMNGIRSGTDDSIFFAKLLCEDLQAYGQKLADAYRESYHAAPPPVNKIHFESAIGDGLIPFVDEYKSWLSGFGELQPELKRISKSWLKFKLYWLFYRPFIDIGMCADISLLIALIIFYAM